MTNNISKRNVAVVPNHPSRPATTWVDQLLQDNLSQFFNEDLFSFSHKKNSSPVPVNLRETGKSYEMEVIAPGLKKEDFKLQVTNDLLTVSFEQETSNEEATEGLLRQEYRLHSFSRSFSLDDSVEVNKIQGEYSNGILKITLPKKEDARKISKTIEIR